MKKERRNVTVGLEIRKSDEGKETRTVEGYALVFDTESVDLGGFRERIEPGSLEGVLERSDVLALLNHDITRGVLARSKNGQGTLTLTVDEKGLKYTFEAPLTALGDEVLEGVRRGDITASSFAFTVAEDAWEKKADGTYLRVIKRFLELYDVSAVYHPAYEETTVDTRGLDAFKRSEQQKEKEACAEESEDSEDNGTGESEDEDEATDQTAQEDSADDSESEDEGRSQDPTGKETRNNENNITILKRNMEKRKFSLLGAIRSIVNNQPLDEAAQQIVAEGRAAAGKAGVEASGQIQLPTDMRADGLMTEGTPANGIITGEAEEGGNAVPTETFDVLGPLTERMIITQLGARMISLTGNVEIPTYTGADVAWEGEISPAKKTAGKFPKVKLSPKRLSAEMLISKQFLLQTSPSVEALIRQDLINRIGLKLQSTILGSGAGNDTTPKGMLNGVSPDAKAITYEDVVQMEADLEEKNVFGDLKYALSPSAKAILRTTKKDAGSGLFVMDGGEVLGVPALSTGGMAKKGLILGDWTNLWIANFGAIDLIVDPYTAANTAQIRLVVNAWFDYAEVRDTFVKRILN